MTKSSGEVALDAVPDFQLDIPHRLRLNDAAQHTVDVDPQIKLDHAPRLRSTTANGLRGALLHPQLMHTSYYSQLVNDQSFAVVPSLHLESGQKLENCQIAYKTWGTLNSTRDNVLIVCHALTGSSDVVDWWRPLFGSGKALDPGRYFIFCANCLGSPYGSHSPLSIDPKTAKPYGATFTKTTIRDDVRCVGIKGFAYDVNKS